ncbi:putative heme-binding domain-containing protein [Pedobacter sp. ok626]|nr:putative heme-binding domain-containing protein [Pedobacter sp. ok626]
MIKFSLSLVCSFIFFGGINFFLDKPKAAFAGPDELEITRFTGPEVTPSPACLSVAPTGEVFVGIDMMGSLGKAPNKGRILKLIDKDNNGTMDQHIEFAMVDNPRGIIAQGDKVFVLHTTFSKETGKATGMDLVVFEDKNNDGIADGPAKPLIENISNAKYIAERGTDHATNGIRMGIDGWIYIAVGDFGFHNAVDRSGKKLTMLGGGIVRVRPDGTEMEIYTHGTRNVYDLAIDPNMNIFTRENTNDGGGWNVRFSHHIQSGEYGYPVLFQHFTDEIVPALADLGGGSGTGALYMDEPNWPEKYNKVPMMADWGQSMLYIHRVSPDGPTFTQKDEDFIKLSQITDLDVDGSGRLYLSAWDGAGYSGSPSKGYVVRAVPKNWTYKAFPDVKKASIKALVELLKSPSAVARITASQELITRPAKQVASTTLKVVSNKDLSSESRIAALYTFAQVAGENAIPTLVKLTADDIMKESALRALADRKSYLKNVPTEPFLASLKDPSKRVQAIATIGLGRLGHIETATALLQTKVPDSFIEPAKDVEGPHATPNSSIILPHLAVQALVNINAVDACVAAIGSENSNLALWALRYMHQQKAVDGLINAYSLNKDEKLKKQILITLSRLYKKENAYDASWWWGTRPDSHGPYFKAVLWSASPAIEKFLVSESEKAGASQKQFFTDLNARHRMDIPAFATEEKIIAAEEPKVDLEKIKNKPGQVGDNSIEDVLLAIAKLPGDAVKGKALFTSQGCFACHSINKGEKMKGPFMGQIGSIMNREQIAESILKPNASISQGFATVMISAKGDKTYMGFITEETANKVVMRNIVGEVFNIKASDILSRQEMDSSMMPAGLANSLSYNELASLVTFLSLQKK